MVGVIGFMRSSDRIIQNCASVHPDIKKLREGRVLYQILMIIFKFEVCKNVVKIVNNNKSFYFYYICLVVVL